MTLNERLDKIYDESIRNDKRYGYNDTVKALSDLFTGNYKGFEDEKVGVPFTPDNQEEILQAIESRVPQRLMRIFRDKYKHPWRSKSGNVIRFAGKRTTSRAYNLMRDIYDGIEHLDRVQKYLSNKDTISNIADAVGGQVL